MDLRIGAIDEFRFIPEFTPLPAVDDVPPVNPFSSFFNAAMDLVNETNQLQLTAEQWQTDLATGKTDDVLNVLLAQGRAYNALNFTVQVTNKIIESYREIMRMSM